MEQRTTGNSTLLSLHQLSPTNRPFDLPETGKIAVKSINYYGDEVLKRFEV